ncbi:MULTISPECIES: hypothetical protein [unclassified Streptomyces]|uniref:hypothetical protein n=1 Tax=unclassified Streptomyces TaxID=2593676 RepID=UPI00081DB217|nr:MULTISPECIES: hypothetical protein [unclassified Streptomyces]MYR92441.1 hypothetical protein [Streptomyces sp. SID4937]SCD33906.1 hypothetical protein GA0115243_101163 [Streptomyces sp. ScaeMP-e83]
MSDNFPPPPPEQPQPERQVPVGAPWPSPWAAPAPPPGKQRTGLIVTLAVGGGLVAAGAIVALVYSLMGSVSEAMELPPARSDAPYSDPYEYEEEEPLDEEPVEEPVAPEPDVKRDVTITACTRDPQIGWQSADVKVVNGSSSPADYYISVEFLDKNGVRVAEGGAGVLGLGPGKTAVKKAQGVGEVPQGTTCRINDLSRTPSSEE